MITAPSNSQYGRNPAEGRAGAHSQQQGWGLVLGSTAAGGVG